jgi:hypothetical protein
MTDDPRVIEVDYREIEDRLLRQAAKARAFRELYGGGSAERAPGQSATGRMSVQHPPANIRDLKMSRGSWG